MSGWSSAIVATPLGDLVAEGVVGHGAHAYRVQRKVGSTTVYFASLLASPAPRTRRRIRMAATADVLKPDFGSQRKHFIFTERPRAACASRSRASSRRSSRPTPRSGRRRPSPTRSSTRMGELGFLGLHVPGGVRRPGRRLLLQPRARARRWAARCPAASSMGVAVHTDMAMPPILKFGTEEQKQEWVVPAIAGREDPLPRHHRAGRRLRRRRHQDARGAGRRRVRHQRLEDLHHERPPRRLDRARHEDRPRRRLRRLHALPRADGRARRDPREEAREARHARLRHRAARVPGRARAGRPPCSARSARASTTSCGSSRASA